MKNFFEIFALDQNFSLDLDLLEQKYFDFQKQFHPDKAGVQELENSMDVNQAYEVLKNPLRRAAHILQLNNIDIETDGNHIKPDMATLEQILEIQENLPNLNQQEIVQLKNSLNIEIKSLLEQAAQKLENKDFATAAQILIKAKYLDKIFQDLRKK